MFSPQPSPSPSPSPSVSASAGPAGAPAAASTAGGGGSDGGAPQPPPPPGSSSSSSAEAAVAASPRPPKRIRLSLACNQCRKRKVRCDASTPRCRNCVARRESCETTNLRNSGPAVRQWPAKDGPAPLAAPAVDPRPRDGVSEPVSHPGRAQRPEPRPGPSSSGELRHGRTGSLSWLSRAYRAQEAEGGGGLGPQHASSPPELVVNTDGDRAKVKFMGGSSLQCICRFVDLHLHHWGLEPVGSLFRHGMRRSEEFPLPLRPDLPDLPAAPEMERYVEAFFNRVHPLFPVLDRPAFAREVQQQCGQAPGSLREGAAAPPSVPFLAMAYAVAAIGADERAGVATATSTRYLTAAYGLYAHLVATPYLDSVRALLLLALALRGQIRDGQAWQVLGQAVRMAHSIGLHRHLADLPDGGGAAPAGPEGASLRRRTWWACYALEKLMQLESGRPSIIHGPEDDQLLAQSLAGRVAPAPDAFAAWVALSRILGRISQHIYDLKAPSAWHLLSETAALDQALVAWEQSLPDALQIQPSHFGVRAGGREGSALVAAFLAQQFYHAQIALFRAALVFPAHSWADEVAKHRGSLPNAARLGNSANLCLAAAREALTQALQLADGPQRSNLLLGPTPPFLAAIVLALAVLQQPARRLARAELELLREASRLVEDLYRAWAFDDAFVAGCAALRHRVAAVVQLAAERAAAAPDATATPPRGGSGGATVPARVDAAAPANATAPLPSPSETVDVAATTLPSEQLGAPPPLMDPFMSFDGADFEELWSMVGPDFAWDSGSAVIF